MAKKSASEKKSGRLLNVKKYIPYHLVGTANAYSRGGSRIYQQLFGVGVIEWRILSVVASAGKATANMICGAIDLDKGAASRSVRTLETAGYVRLSDDVHDSRKRLIALTAKGRALHDRMLKIALAREKRLLANFTKADKEQLLALLHKLDSNLTVIDDFDYAALLA